MKNWIKSLISAVIFFIVCSIWNYLMLKNIDWLHTIITAVVFGILDFIFYTICDRYSKKRREDKK